MIEKENQLVVYEFSMSDCEDPEIYAGEPLWKWQHSEQGQWVMSHSVTTPTFFIRPDPTYFGYRVSIVAELDSKDLTYFKLKWK